MQKFDNYVGAANAARMLGICLVETGDLERAEHFLDMARDFYHHTEMTPYLVHTLSSLMQLFVEQKRLVEARDIQVEVERLMRELTY